MNLHGVPGHTSWFTWKDEEFGVPFEVTPPLATYFLSFSMIISIISLTEPMLLVKKGDGKGLGEESSKCHKKVLQDNIQTITKPAPHHLSCILDVNHILGVICRNSHSLERWFQSVLQVAVTCTKHTKWKTVTAMGMHSLCHEVSRLCPVQSWRPNWSSNPKGFHILRPRLAGSPSQKPFICLLWSQFHNPRDVFPHNL